MRRFISLPILVLGLMATGTVAQARESASSSIQARSASCASAVSWRNARRVVGRTATIRGPVAGTKYASSSNGSPDVPRHRCALPEFQPIHRRDLGKKPCPLRRAGEPVSRPNDLRARIRQHISRHSADRSELPFSNPNRALGAPSLTTLASGDTCVETNRRIQFEHGAVHGCRTAVRTRATRRRAMCGRPSPRSRP